MAKCLKEIACRRICKRRRNKASPPKVPEDRRNGAHVVTTDYVPQDHAVQETLKYLCSGSRYDLAKLLEERDYVERQTRRRRKAKNSKKNKDNKDARCERVVREPTISSVEQFDQACRHADIAARYKLPGRVSYNFSRSSEWNRTNLSEIPSPPPFGEDPDEGTSTTSTTYTTREPSGIFTPYFFAEPDFDLSGFSFSLGSPSTSSSANGAGDSSDWPYVSAEDWDMWRPNPPLTLTLYPIPEEDEGEDEDEEKCEGAVTEARALTMTKIPIWQVE
ncbi:uncharacterized protein F4812DRAFT_457348 [Daldinia caldariorum]|uniref:uncharacterized protein n=1 Tax=Daldinia caldariorum TaxID=326644 RepID=UPI002008C61E|nr:uncharacterized protein F4812DRAFT_457348 [Daldinia caldariorum]KAI1469950.1 hypothetical protein F4812DRAFT_457348 [Daldinia caldariorum]